MRSSSQTPGGFLLTGAAGLLGRALAAACAQRSIPLLQATRHPTPPPDSQHIPWQPQRDQPFPNPSLLEGLDVAIHLSGANLAAQRWTPAYKHEIVTSRTLSTAGLARTLAALARPPRLLISASATGIYGDRGDEILTEASPPGTGFLSQTCQAWEAATAPAAGIRVVHLRFGVVLDPHGGALAKVLPLFKAGLGGRLGTGRQWMSWITIDDLVRAVLHIAGRGADATDTPPLSPALSLSTPRSPELEGPVNCVTPAPITNDHYTRALASVLHRPAFARAPAFALRLALGEMADAALLASCRATPQKLLATGFHFQFPRITPALAHLLAG